MKTQYKNIFIISIITLMFMGTINAQTETLDNYTGKWNFDTDNSKVSFKIGNLFLLNVTGDMNVSQGYFKLEDKTEISGIIDITSLNTGITKRDEHLKSEDFFYIEKYPEIKFFSNHKIEKSDDKEYQYQTKGMLTIRGIQKEESVLFNIQKESNDVIHIKGEAEINRFDYDLDYKMMGMGKEATVILDIRATLDEDQ